MAGPNFKEFYWDWQGRARAAGKPFPANTLETLKPSCYRLGLKQMIYPGQGLQAVLPCLSLPQFSCPEIPRDSLKSESTQSLLPKIYNLIGYQDWPSNETMLVNTRLWQRLQVIWCFKREGLRNLGMFVEKLGVDWHCVLPSSGIRWGVSPGFSRTCFEQVCKISGPQYPHIQDTENSN